MRFEPGKKYVLLVESPQAARQIQRDYERLVASGGGCLFIWGGDVIEQEQLHAIHPDVAYIPNRSRGGTQ